MQMKGKGHMECWYVDHHMLPLVEGLPLNEEKEEEEKVEVEEQEQAMWGAGGAGGA